MVVLIMAMVINSNGKCDSCGGDGSSGENDGCGDYDS